MAELGISTQAEAAAQIGVTQSSVSRWLGGALPRDDELSKVAEWLDVGEDDLARSLYASRTTRRSRQDQFEDRLALVEEQVTRLVGGFAALSEELAQLAQRTGQGSAPSGRPKRRGSR